MDNILLTPEEVAQLLIVDVADVHLLIEKGELAVLQIAGRWRITAESVKEFLARGLRDHNLKSLNNTLNDYSTWTRLLQDYPDLSKAIESMEYEENTFGAFLKNALMVSRAEKLGQVVSLKSRRDDKRKS